MSKTLKTSTRLITLLALAALFIALGASLHSKSPRTAYIYFTFAALYLFMLAAKVIIPLFLTARQRAAAQITSSFISIGVFFLTGFVFALGAIACGVAWIISDRGIAMGIAACLFGLAFFLYHLARLLIFRRDTKAAIISTLRKHGFCTHCGYDLRESSIRCPECGNPVPPERQNKTRRVSEGRTPHPGNVEI